MLANQPYQPISIIRFEQSLLNLGAALDQAAQKSSLETSKVAVLEVQRLTNRLERKP